MEIQGHRGARGLWPENTVPGFARTLEVGVDVIELDVGLTADGIPVLHHDQALRGDTVRDRGPYRPRDPMYPYVGRPIRELALAQIKTVDAGVVHERFAATQTALTMTAAAAGLASPWKKRLSAVPIWVLKRASLSAAEAAKMNAASQPILPQAGPSVARWISDHW